ncbi:16S rRNA (uracil(1498)-N(3))-methyltransferase [Mycoplasma todarodis]|uniref:Ribosomal RNA small subunit methyltransferase E n=1 Tax=Mycoplasma todarodis TaxID=1937191 RepID=A0A4R0XMJ5_9MOLU|nr:16S rRNA (uracil(1498)-N(3))-methyltransferase [Mycoplasma todarodis]TCG10682.1 16S rRNA (uracil(1498)-N(3))-methyltransferase [Mycoplasma todarodis]
MFRFFVTNKMGETHFEISEETYKHMKVARVLNEKFICIYESKFYVCEMDGQQAKIIEVINEDHEHNGEVIVAAALINIKRFEWMVQKAAELGATKIIPLITERIEIKMNDKFYKKIERWNQISHNACEQSFRNVKMIVTEPMNFKDVLEIEIENKFIAHEKTNSKVASSLPTNSIFFVGPEGGFSEREVALAEQKGCENISLGKRILRAETASIFMLSKVM